MKLPWMPVYVDDLIGSTADMSAEEFGAYVRLLCHIWSRGPLEMDDAVCCRIAGVKLRVWRRIRKRFEPCKRQDGTDGLSHPRLEREKFERNFRAEERANSGRKGALARWKRGNGHGSAIGSANGSLMASQIPEKRTPTVICTTDSAASPRAAPPSGGGGLPRLAEIVDPAIEATERNRAFIRSYRSKQR